jgi:hypothetical protein
VNKVVICQSDGYGDWEVVWIVEGEIRWKEFPTGKEAIEWFDKESRERARISRGE